MGSSGIPATCISTISVPRPLSFADGIRTEPGDTFEIEMKEFGAPLRNTLGAKAAESFAYGGVAAL